SWRLRPYGDEYRRPILPLLKAVESGKYRRTNGSQSSTRRLESGFERAAREVAQKIAYEQGKKCFKCSVCPPEQRWGHKKNQPTCPKHPKHDEWLAKQVIEQEQQHRDNTVKTSSMIVVNDSSAWYEEQQSRAISVDESSALAATASFIAKQVPLIDLPELENKVIDDEHDPDFDLAQYHSRIVEHSSGFR
ncbi:hypothetical protein EG329_011207, partial [Mollisiaceae sp. DMI_Dod_QoI]